MGDLVMLPVAWEPRPRNGAAYVQTIGPGIWLVEWFNHWRGSGGVEEYSTREDAAYFALELANHEGLDLHVQGEGRRR